VGAGVESVDVKPGGADAIHGRRGLRLLRGHA
jgi:hypothetical protein